MGRRFVATQALALLLAGCGLPSLPAAPAEPAATAHHDSLAAAWADDARSAHPAGGACLGRHLEEAIELNLERMPVYAAWSDRRSEPVSDRLIRQERGALAPAAWVDRRARRYQEAGVPIVCAEFVSMALTPPLPASPLPPPAHAFEAAEPAEALRARLAAAYGADGFAGVAAAADAALERLAPQPPFHCMRRHLLESIWRIALLGPHHERTARERGLESPRALSETLLRMHLAMLPEAAELDIAAAPLQARGIPILCGDVPALR